jgi:hypothetical protein
VYLALLLVRLILDVVVLGVNPFAGAPPGTAPLTGTALLLLAFVDALFGLSTGLLMGRTVGVYLEYRSKPSGGPPAGTNPPLPTGR